MGAEQVRRWESGALAHAADDPFGQGPLPWLRGTEQYVDEHGRLTPWYAVPPAVPGRDASAGSGGAPARRTTCTSRSRASPPPAPWLPARRSTSTSR